jgi:hypothetical protein
MYQQYSKEAFNLGAVSLVASCIACATGQLLEGQQE